MQPAFLPTPLLFRHSTTRRRPPPQSYPSPICSATFPDSQSTPSLKISAALAALLTLSAFPSSAHASPFRPTQSQSSTSRTLRHSTRTVARVSTPAIRVTKPSPAGHGLEGQTFVVAGGAAFLASASAVAVTHPIDTLKTLKQGKKQKEAQNEEGGALSIGKLYKGVFSNMLKEAPNAAIYLGTYELFKGMLLCIGILSKWPLVAMCLAGMLGDAVGSIVRVPAEIVNKRVQLGMNDTLWGAVKEAFLSDGGLEGTVVAWEAVLLRDVPYGGLQIAGYEWLRAILSGWGLGGVGLSVLAGGVAGFFAAVVTTPMDVLVTRMSTLRPQCYLETRKYMGVGATGGRILREEGFGGFWVGAGERGLFYMPMIGLFFAGYEGFKKFIGGWGRIFRGGLGLGKGGRRWGVLMALLVGVLVMKRRERKRAMMKS